MRVFYGIQLVQIYKKNNSNHFKNFMGVNSKMSRYLIRIVIEIVIVRKNNDVDEG